MKHTLKTITLAAAALLALSCSGPLEEIKRPNNKPGETETPGDTPEKPSDNPGAGDADYAMPEIEARHVTVVDFDDYLSYSSLVADSQVNTRGAIVANPFGEGKCFEVLNGTEEKGAGVSDCVMVQLKRPIDFTRTGSIKVKIHGPEGSKNCQVALQLKSSHSKDRPAAIITTAVSLKENEWEDFEFDFSSQKPVNNKYNKLYIFFNKGVTEGKLDQKWYFDDIRVPDDDLADIALFKRADGQRPPKPNTSVSWISNSTASPDVIPADKSLDGKWWMWIRGGDSRTSRLGLCYQEAASFNPLGPWTMYENNPVISEGFNGVYDEANAMGPCAVRSIDGKTMFLFYKGVAADGSASILLAKSSDGKNFTKFDGAWTTEAGTGGVVCDGNRYYLYGGRTQCYEFTDPLAGGDAATCHEGLLEKGRGPDYFDCFAINGEKIFRLNGVDKWFMIYQGGTFYKDFPERFHIATSDDLLNWTVVPNKRPLFTRGPRGSWDQGAIWSPSTFEYKDNIYIYYEGWGREGIVPDRDEPYFKPAHSEIGVAVCSKAAFLSWCGL